MAELNKKWRNLVPGKLYIKTLQERHLLDRPDLKTAKLLYPNVLRINIPFLILETQPFVANPDEYILIKLMQNQVIGWLELADWEFKGYIFFWNPEITDYSSVIDSEMPSYEERSKLRTLKRLKRKL